MMGRKYESSDSDGDDLPDLSTLLTVPKTLQQKPSQNNSSPTENDRDRPDSRSSSAPAVEYPILNKKASCDERRVTEHKPLRLAHVDPLLLPLTSLSLKPSEALTIKHNASKQRAEALRQLSKRLARKKSPRKYVESDSSDEEEEDASGKDESYEDVESTGAYKSEDGDLSDFIVNDSASEEELRRPRRTKENSLPSPSQTRRRRLYQKIDRRSSLSPGRNWVGTVLPNSKGKGENMEETKDKVNEPVQYPKLESFDEPDASLKFSPPRRKSPRKISMPSSETAITPPPSPSKGLQTPSKSRPRIPTSPHKPDLRSFWSQEIVDEWNDQYSPEKSPISGRRMFPESREGSPSPSKSPAKSPAKRDKKAIERRKQFESTKHELAISFLKELDDTVTSGKLSTLAAPTGGVKLIWSKKLLSTAGRANWKRETLRSRSEDGMVTNTTTKHHASIELAEKVIDDEDRLLNVLAHEFCHLANFMLSNVKDQPHGASFRSWGSKVSSSFSHRNILVTTKHSYNISYKFIWECKDCHQEYKRHSKSIFPEKHSCGVCKGRLMQVQPIPRNSRKEGKDKDGEYQHFIKKNFKIVKEEIKKGRRSDPTLGEVMTEVARRYRVVKEKVNGEEDLTKEKQELIVLESSDGEDDVGVDNVVEDLDALSLK